MDARDVTYELGGKWHGSRGVAICPAHNEKTGSLSISDGTGRDGNPLVMVKCFGGCDQESVLDALESEGVYLRKERTVYRPVARNPRPAKQKVDPETAIDCVSMLKKWHAQTGLESLYSYSEELGVSAFSLAAIKASKKDADSWAFAMRDGRGNVIGIRTRYNNGQKRAVKGSRSGLIYPPDFPIGEDVWICEGPTDTAAAITLHMCAIGRPSCMGCEGMVVEFLNRVKAKRVIIISDNDGPGKRGADKLFGLIKIPATIWIPPAKDVRQFLIGGGTREVADCMIQNLRWSK